MLRSLAGTLLPRQAPDHWHWRADLHIGVNFCVWALTVDGLRLPPFDRHPDGDGSLRAAGLDADGWQSWLEAVVALAVATIPPFGARDTGPWTPEEIARRQRAHWPHTEWTGTPAVGARLAELWQRYEPRPEAGQDARDLPIGVAEEWRRRAIARSRTASGLPYMRPAVSRQLWRDLARLHARLPTLQVYRVSYPWPVARTVPPVSVLIADADGRLDDPAYAAAVLAAARDLAAHQASA